MNKIVRDTVNKEIAHIHEIMKNVIKESANKNPQPSINDFPELEANEARPFYSEVANYSFSEPNHQRNDHQRSDQLFRRNQIQQTFENSNRLEDLIKKHKQIVGIKPVTRKDINYHANAVGIDRPELITDSKIFYCPTYHNLRLSFAKDYIQEVFGFDASRIPITDVRMCNHISAGILWVTVGENFAREMFNIVGRLQKPNLWIIQSIPPSMIERRKAITSKLEKIRDINPALRYQVRLGLKDFRVFTKNYKVTEYTKYREISISMIDPLQEFPRPQKNSPMLTDDHAKMVMEAVKKAQEAEKARNESEWSTAGKRKKSPQKVEREIRKRLNSPIKINMMIQRVINGEKNIDLNEFNFEDEEDDMELPATPFIPQPGTSGAQSSAGAPAPLATSSPTRHQQHAETDQPAASATVQQTNSTQQPGAQQSAEPAPPSPRVAGPTTVALHDTNMS